jgi:hypothetical protein
MLPMGVETCSVRAYLFAAMHAWISVTKGIVHVRDKLADGNEEAQHMLHHIERSIWGHHFDAGGTFTAYVLASCSFNLVSVNGCDMTSPTAPYIRSTVIGGRTQPPHPVSFCRHCRTAGG